MTGGSSGMNKTELTSRIESGRSHHTTGVSSNGNIEDNKERDSKEKMKIDRPEKGDKKRKELDGYVGFANLPNQVYRKAVKKGFDFTLMVVGKYFECHLFLSLDFFLLDESERCNLERCDYL
jgi:hypothetical protein